VGRLFVANAGGQAILVGLDQFVDNPLHPGAGFALAENDLGETAALAAVQVYMGEAEVSHGRNAQMLKGFLNADSTAVELFE
jgi:hypothetical protein